ncbi:FAD-dependent oxidoreductase [Streptomyces sp. NPDC088387]|uniref:FAD-dependent oxidoreductase n=1 Tax=Streptomyces sp. NPDC088387 TaxID=3365859 RepID=UPI00381A876A
MADRPRILIAGGGIGGLALAQALRRDDQDVVVFERDPTPEVRNQGYRIHIDADANAALQACLAPPLHTTMCSSSGVSSSLVAFYSPQLELVNSLTLPATDGEITHMDRSTFRKVLLTGLDDVVRFGRTVSGFDVTPAGRVRVSLADGGVEEGDLLVGADGARSAICRQLLPHASVRDLGLRCIYGRIPLDDTTRALLPEDFHRGTIWVADDNDCGAGFAPMQFRTRPEEASDYLMVTLFTTATRLGIPGEDEYRRLAAPELRRITADLTGHWHPRLREVFDRTPADSLLPIPIRAGERVAPWPAGPVTVLGDAIHLMPPTGGVGTSAAMQDAATLAGELRKAAEQGRTLVDAVAAYERVMLPRGFDIIDGALKTAALMFGREF